MTLLLAVLATLTRTTSATTHSLPKSTANTARHFLYAFGAVVALVAVGILVGLLVAYFMLPPAASASVGDAEGEERVYAVEAEETATVDSSSMPVGAQEGREGMTPTTIAVASVAVVLFAIILPAASYLSYKAYQGEVSIEAFYKKHHEERVGDEDLDEIGIDLLPRELWGSEVDGDAAGVGGGVKEEEDVKIWDDSSSEYSQ